jgi:hypothetical protein
VHTGVNHLHFREPLDPAVFAGAERELAPQMRAIEGFSSFQVIQVEEDRVVLVITGDDEATVDRVPTEVGSPWMREHVVPLLARPADRQVGPVIASAGV